MMLVKKRSMLSTYMTTYQTRTHKEIRTTSKSIKYSIQMNRMRCYRCIDIDKIQSVGHELEQNKEH